MPLHPQLKYPQRCSKCAACMNSCPVHAITKIEPFEVDASKCAEREDCFVCVMACKTGALVLTFQKEG